MVAGNWLKDYHMSSSWTTAIGIYIQLGFVISPIFLSLLLLVCFVAGSLLLCRASSPRRCCLEFSSTNLVSAISIRFILVMADYIFVLKSFFDSIKCIWFLFYVVCGPVFSVFEFCLWWNL